MYILYVCILFKLINVNILKYKAELLDIGLCM